MSLFWIVIAFTWMAQLLYFNIYKGHKDTAFFAMCIIMTHICIVLAELKAIQGMLGG